LIYAKPVSAFTNMAIDQETGGPAEPPIDGSDLCTHCGLCCHGVLHEWGHLETHEIEPMAALGMGLERRGDNIAFSLPCTRVDGTICSIYEQRPIACRGYRCALLKRYEAREIPLDEALALVSKGKALLDAVRSRLRPGERFRDLRLAWRGHIGGEAPVEWAPGEQSERSGAFLAMALLHRFFDRHFRLSQETPLVSPERAAELGREKNANSPPSTPST
jgi:Fe-S-cluster containining protein